MEKKPWYLSKTVWGALIAGGTTLAAIFGYNFDLAGLDNQIVTLVGAALAVYGRIVAVLPVGR